MQLLLLVQLLSCYSLSIWSCSGYIYRRRLSMRSLHRKRGEEEEEEEAHAAAAAAAIITCILSLE
jgi:hypothetical protein